MFYTDKQLTKCDNDTLNGMWNHHWVFHSPMLPVMIDSDIEGIIIVTLHGLRYPVITSA